MQTANTALKAYKQLEKISKEATNKDLKEAAESHMLNQKEHYNEVMRRMTKREKARVWGPDGVGPDEL